MRKLGGGFVKRVLFMYASLPPLQQKKTLRERKTQRQGHTVVQTLSFSPSFGYTFSRYERGGRKRRELPTCSNSRQLYGKNTLSSPCALYGTLVCMRVLSSSLLLRSLSALCTSTVQYCMDGMPLLVGIGLARGSVSCLERTMYGVGEEEEKKRKAK